MNEKRSLIDSRRSTWWWVVKFMEKELGRMEIIGKILVDFLIGHGDGVEAF